MRKSGAGDVESIVTGLTKTGGIITAAGAPSASNSHARLRFELHACIVPRSGDGNCLYWPAFLVRAHLEPAELLSGAGRPDRHLPRAHVSLACGVLVLETSQVDDRCAGWLCQR